jgi:tetratricopeptide (TPR) repeat protein
MRGDLLGAVVAFEDATRAAPASADAHLGLGLVAGNLGDVVVAEAALDRAEELGAYGITIGLARGDLARRGGDFAEAIREYRAALHRDERNVAAWVKLGNALAATDALEDAERAFDEALRVNADFAPALNGRGVVRLGRDHLHDARVDFERAAALDPNDANPWMNLSLLHRRLGNDEAAAEALEQARARDPERATLALAR